MKLTSIQVEQTLSQIRAEAIPEDDPVIPELSDLFGDHTFFIDDNGLNIVEPIETDSDLQSAQLVNVADWRDADMTRLAAHEPEPTNVFVTLAVNRRTH
ncbi:MAG: hypothetical protein J2P54_20240 [Bradyrhizobiaceae bacterium]|nr:hypothetical protein [Bradyrhizobiaceae bacterium]